MADDRKTTMSGYDVTFSAFVPADPYKPEQMVEAIKMVDEAAVELSGALGTAVDVRRVYRARKAVDDADEPEAEA